MTEERLPLAELLAKAVDHWFGFSLGRKRGLRYRLGSHDAADAGRFAARHRA